MGLHYVLTVLDERKLKPSKKKTYKDGRTFGAISIFKQGQSLIQHLQTDTFSFYYIYSNFNDFFFLTGRSRLNTKRNKKIKKFRNSPGVGCYAQTSEFRVGLQKDFEIQKSVYLKKSSKGLQPYRNFLI